MDVNNGRMYQELVELSGNIVIVTDPGFNIRYVSPAVSKSFNVEPLALIGKNVFEFVSSDSVEQWKECIAHQQLPFSEEISLTLGAERKAYFDVQVSNLHSGNDTPEVALHLHDITRKKEKEKELVKSNAQLDQVIYKTTHDLRSPVRSALGLVSLAESAPQDEKPRYIEMIRNSLLKLDGLIEEMNDFFRNDKLAIQRAQINITDIIRKEVELLSFSQQAKDIKIELKIESESGFYSDPIRVRTILTNILSNAIKYSDRKKNEPFIHIVVFINEEFCDIRIVDNGIGIEEQHLNKIFDLFFRATDQSQGTGLGLFIVKDTVQKLKGVIEVTSKVDQGTTFRIQIPNQIYQPVMA